MKNSWLADDSFGWEVGSFRVQCSKIEKGFPGSKWEILSGEVTIVEETITWVELPCSAPRVSSFRPLACSIQVASLALIVTSCWLPICCKSLEVELWFMLVSYKPWEACFKATKIEGVVLGATIVEVLGSKEVAEGTSHWSKVPPMEGGRCCKDDGYSMVRGGGGVGKTILQHFYPS